MGFEKSEGKGRTCQPDSKMEAIEEKEEIWECVMEKWAMMGKPKAVPKRQAAPSNTQQVKHDRLY